MIPAPSTSELRFRRILRWFARQPLRPGRSHLKRLAGWVWGPQRLREVYPGLLMQLDLRIFDQTKLHYFAEECEPALQWLVHHLLPVGGTFVDVGANAGFFGLIALHYREARACFVEPHPSCAAGIRTSLTANGFTDRAFVFECAAAAREGRCRFETQSDSGATYHVLADESPGRQVIDVQQRPLAALLKEAGFPRVDFLKVDAEGQDLQALHGLGDWLAPERIPCLHVEADHEAGAISELLAGRGYVPIGTQNAGYPDYCARSKRCGEFPALACDVATSRNKIWIQRDSAHHAFLVRWSELHRRWMQR